VPDRETNLDHTADPAGQALADLLRKTTKGRETVLDVIRDTIRVDGDDSLPRLRLEIGQRDIQPEPPRAPVRAESPPRAHTFHHIAGFNAYLSAYGGAHTVVLADAGAGTIDAVLDETAPKGFEIVNYQPQVHPFAAPWIDIIASRRPIRELADFLAEHRGRIAEPDPVYLRMVLGQVRASVQTTLHRGQRPSESLNGVVIKTKVQGEDAKGEPLDLPETIVVKTPLYVDDEDCHAIEFDLTLSAASDDQEVYGRLTSPDLLRVKVEAFEDRIACLDLPDGAVATLGGVDHAEWRYLRAAPDRTSLAPHAGN